MTTHGSSHVPTLPESMPSGTAELKLKIEQQSRLLEHSRRLQHETEAIEVHTRTWVKEQLKVVKTNDEQFNGLNDQVNQLKTNEEYVTANETLKETKDRIGLKDAERQKNLRNRELTLEVNQSQDALDLQTLILEKTQEMLDTMMQLETTNEYIRTQGLQILEAASAAQPPAP